jgi:hypothetical protein
VDRVLARPVCALVALAAWTMPLAAQRWQVQYFYDKNKSTLAIGDFQFASPDRGVAVGVIEEARRRRPVALVTADGGARWEMVPLEEAPVSLFLLNENIGWLVTAKGLWQTVEAGKSWRKLPRVPADVNRVFFLDEKHGWAACTKKTVLETVDGGQRWIPVEAASKAPGDPKYSTYTWITFPTPQLGLVTGWNLPPRRNAPSLPEWVDPEATLKHRETPHISFSIETNDGGKNWRSSSSSAFGAITRIRLRPQGSGLGLVEYTESFPFPSEIYQILWPSGKSNSVYKNKKFAVSDIWLAADGTAYLAGAVHDGQLRILPGKVQVLQSQDYKNWSPLEVDYRATANRTVLAAAGDRMWLATDTGMILKLAP